MKALILLIIVIIECWNLGVNALRIEGLKKLAINVAKVTFGLQPIFTGRIAPRPATFEQRKVISPKKFAFPSTSAIPRIQQRVPIELPQSSQFVRNAVKTVGPSVVRVDCEREVSDMMSAFGESGKEGDVVKVCGSGFVVSPDGYILTNSHVVENARRVTIQLSNGRSFKASVVATDELTDLAVIKADISKEKDFSLVTAPLGDSSVLHAGDWVIAVGCPVGLDFTVTLGVVSSPKRSASEVGVPHLKGSYIQTDAALNSGNSGGPLVNDRGEVVGINTMVRTNTEAIGFAIPINRARSIYEVLRQGKKPSHAFFGIEANTVTPDSARIHNEDPNAPRIPITSGALILRVGRGSPAEAAGLRRFDVIVEVNGIKILSADDADTVLDSCKPGVPSTITVFRGEQGNAVELKATPVDLHQLILEMKKQQQQKFIIIKP